SESLTPALRQALLNDYHQTMRIPTQESGAVQPEAWENARLPDAVAVRFDLLAAGEVEPVEPFFFEAEDDVFRHSGPLVRDPLFVQIDIAGGMRNFRKQLGATLDIIIVRRCGTAAPFGKESQRQVSLHFVGVAEDDGRV